jgi:epoxyqueuosine reductase QueG
LPIIPCRASSRLPKNAKAVISCAFPYYIKESGKRNLSYYACVCDYHTVVGNILNNACEKLRGETGENFASFTDNSPIPEVKAAVLSGIGVKGDNGLLITNKYGSYVFLGEIVTDLDLETSSFSGECSHCGRCRTECPTRNGFYDKNSCLSSITQKKGVLSQEEDVMIKKSRIIWGCDICQLCCPMNKKISETNIESFRLSYNSYADKDNILSAEDRAYLWRGKEVILRNLEIVLGDSDKMIL